MVNFEIQNSNIFIQGNALENVVCEIASILSGLNELIGRAPSARDGKYATRFHGPGTYNREGTIYNFRV